MVCCEHRVDAVVSSNSERQCASSFVSWIVQPLRRLGFYECFLSEEREFALGMRCIKRDHIRERTCFNRLGCPCEIRVQVSLELRIKDQRLRFADLVPVLKISDVNQCCALLLQHRECLLKDLIGLRGPACCKA